MVMIIPLAIVAILIGFVGTSYWRHFSYLRSIERVDLTNLGEVHRLARMMAAHEFPLHFLYLILKGIFNTFPSPPVNVKLLANGKFISNPRLRLANTTTYFATVIRGRDLQGNWRPDCLRAFRNLEKTHREAGVFTYEQNEHFVATLGGVLEAFDYWLPRFGWRRPIARELAVFHAWMADVAAAMHIREFPQTASELLEWTRSYESRWFRLAERDPIASGRARALLTASLGALEELAPGLLRRSRLEDVLFTIGSDDFVAGFGASRPRGETQGEVRRLLARIALLSKCWALVAPFRVRPFNFLKFSQWLRNGKSLSKSPENAAA